MSNTTDDLPCRFAPFGRHQYDWFVYVAWNGRRLRRTCAYCHKPEPRGGAS